MYTVLSKRKLQWFVDTKRVAGWNDARFPTIQGILRRGMTVQALREFILGQGFSMSMNTMEWDKIWTINKRVIDPVAPRFTAVTKEQQAVLHLANFGDDSVPQVAMVDLHPKNKAVGSKTITRSARVILEQDDAKLIKDGEEVSPVFFSSQRALTRSQLFLRLGPFRGSCRLLPASFCLPHPRIRLMKNCCGFLTSIYEEITIR